MTTPSLSEIRDSIEQMLAVFEQDENRFYVVLDIAHHLHSEISELISADDE